MTTSASPKNIRKARRARGAGGAGLPISKREILARRKSDELEMVLGSMNQGISAFDGNMRLTVWNTRYAEFFGMDPNAIKSGMTFIELLELQKGRGNFEGDPKVLQAAILNHVSAGEDFRATVRLATGHVISSIHSPAPGGGWIGTHEDVTERHQNSERLSETARQLTTALASMRQGLAMFSSDRRLIVWNNKYRELMRLGAEELKQGMSLRDILDARVRVGSYCGDVESALAREFEALRISESLEILDTSSDGRILAAFVKRLDDGGFVVTHEDITDHRQIEAQIEHDALHDALTGLPNRRFLDLVLADREATYRSSGDGVAVLHIDLDHFKQINDTLGHEAGDAMLVHAASVLKSSLRDSDFVSRAGGDEFVAVCPLGRGPKYLAGLAARIVKQMRRPVMYHGHECRFGVSIGIAHQRGARVDAKKLLIKADIALYQAKSRGRGCYQFFTPAMQSAVTRTKNLADEIQTGIEKGEFVAHYQAQVDAQTHEISGVEALVRWNHPSRGLLTPDKFLKIADEMGVVGTLDGIVLEQTLDDFASWKAQGLCVPRASVNVSAKRLRDPGLLKTLNRLKIAPGTISFELLESIYLDEADDTVTWNIDQIREMGIDIEIDDFGTGHTSILSLLKLKPQRLKIDRQLVTPIVGSPSQQQLLRSVVEIGHSLGIKVTAEGVETLEHAHIAASLGCDVLQGYAFSRPVSAESFAVFATGRLRYNTSSGREMSAGWPKSEKGYGAI